ncbi:MAG: hypothetical protein ACKO4Y_01395 [Flavobacteriales bacterium]
MHPQRIIILCFALLGIASVFIPWYSLQVLFVKTSVNGMEGNGVLFLILFFIVLILSLLADRGSIIKGLNFWIILCASGCSGILGIYELLSLADQSDTLLGQVIAEVVTPGIGLYLLIGTSFSIILVLSLFPLMITKK